MRHLKIYGWSELCGIQGLCRTETLQCIEGPILNSSGKKGTLDFSGIGSGAFIIYVLYKTYTLNVISFNTGIFVMN